MPRSDSLKHVPLRLPSLLGRVAWGVCLGCTVAIGLATLAGCVHQRTVSEPVVDPWAGGGTRSETFDLPGMATLKSNADPFATEPAVEVLSPAVAPLAVPQLATPAPGPADNSRVTRLDVPPAYPTVKRLPTTTSVQPVGYQANSAVAAEQIPPLHLDPPVSVSDTFIETDIRQALQSLAGQAEKTIVVDDAVRGTVTATIEQARFGTALNQVLHPLGFVYRPIDGVYYIGVADPESALFDHLAERYRYNALHRSPAELIEMVSSRRRQFIRPSPTGGWVIVEAPAQQARQILDELEELDEPVPQVVLGALICVYSPETSFRFGFDMDSGVRVFNRTTQAAISGLTLSGVVGDAGAGDLNDFRVTQSVLRILEQKGYVKIRAAPRVMAQDGEKANIHIGRETFFSVQPESNTGVLYRQDIQQVSSGIMLEITPHIREPIVTIRIDRAEVSEDIRSDETQANPSDRFPVINRRSVNTTVHVKDGETIVIGGLTQRQKVDQLNQTPGLSKLPFVGRLFQRIEKVDQLVEVAIFISPHIVKGTQHVVEDPATGFESAPASF